MRNAKILIIGLGILLMALTIATRVYNYNSTFFYNIDEQIAVRVVERMHQSGDLDPNWALAEGQRFWNIHYNFSSYLYASDAYYSVCRWCIGHFSISSINWDYGTDLLVLRSFSILLGGLGGVLVFLIARKIWNTRAGLLSLLLYAIAPILVQDSHYARPESFVTFLTLIVVYLSIKNRELKRWPLFFSTFLVSILFACKADMLLLLPVALYPILDHFYAARNSLTSHSAKNKGRYLSVLAVVLAGGILGIAIGMPHALLNPGLYFNDLKALHAEYTARAYWPVFSSFDPGDITYVFRNVPVYFAETLGIPVLLAFVVGIVATWKRRAFDCIFLLAVPVFLFYALFWFQSVFFERNFSHVVPLLLIMASIGVCSFTNLIRKVIGHGSWLNATLAFMLVVGLVIVPAIQTYRIDIYTLGGQNAKDAQSYEARLLEKTPDAQVVYTGVFSSQFNSQIRLQDTVLKVADFNDGWTKHYVDRAVMELGFERIGEYRGPFNDVVPSTLQVFLAPNYIYLYAKATTGITRLPELTWRATGGWTIGGTYVKTGPRIASKEYFYGSWSGSDENIGVLSSSPIRIESPAYLGMYVMTGPNPTGQIVGIDTDGDGNPDIKYSGSAVQRWDQWVVDLTPFIGKEIRIIAIDQGKDWGEWVGVSEPFIILKTG
jgi:hypothetical protein